MADSTPDPTAGETTLSMDGPAFQDEMVGRRIGSYRLESVLAEGGMGRVYLAQHTALNRRCAVKLIRPEVSSQEEFQKRFLREMRIGARLEHPGIVTYFDAGEDGGCIYLAMEYFKGKELAEFFMGKPADVADVEGIGLQLADALEMAHSKQIVHRDMKPQNVLLNAVGQVKILDFGLAKLLVDEKQSRLTAAGTVLGSPAFMAPEQFLQPDAIDTRVDVYGLGAVLYFCLAGQAPYTGANPLAIAREIQAQKLPPPPSALREGVPAGLEAVVQKAMAFDVEERYATVAALRSALERAGDEATRLEDAVDHTTTVFPLKEGLPPRPTLRIFLQDAGCREHELDHQTLVIGRDSRADIVLNHDTVSRRHAILEPVGYGYVIRDAGSRAGITVNGQHVERAPLRHGDSIQITFFAMEYRTQVGDEAATVCRQDPQEQVLRRSFSLLPSGMSYRVRLLRCSPEDVFSSGDTLPIGGGGIFLPLRSALQVGTCLEVQLVWPDNRNGRFLGEVAGSILEHHRRLVAVKLHRLGRARYEQCVRQHVCSDWLE